jgi:hypothetical protein
MQAEPANMSTQFTASNSQPKPGSPVMVWIAAGIVVATTLGAALLACVATLLP